jgi:hypothetical protein
MDAVGDVKPLLNAFPPPARRGGDGIQLDSLSSIC